VNRLVYPPENLVVNQHHHQVASLLANLVVNQP